jgi:hypothetical protein
MNKQGEVVAEAEVTKQLRDGVLRYCSTFVDRLCMRN